MPDPTDSIATDPLFSSAHAALTFALHYVAQVERPTIYRLGGGGGTSKGLGGLDGAAQAGMIRCELARLSKDRSAILVARIAPHAVPCSCSGPCCSKWRPNSEWKGAVDSLSASDGLALSALSGCLSHSRIRRAIVMKYFGERVRLGELADEYHVGRNTVGAHNSKIIKALREEERKAWLEFSGRLDASGILGDADTHAPLTEFA
jgi:hypothetical protein